MSTEKTTVVGKPGKTKPKPRARRTKSEVPHAENLQLVKDYTDPRTTSCSNENLVDKNGAESPHPEPSNGLIRPRSSSRRRAYIIKRPQSAPFFGRVTPRPFSADDPDDSTTSILTSLQNNDTRKVSVPTFASGPVIPNEADFQNSSTPLQNVDTPKVSLPSFAPSPTISTETDIHNGPVVSPALLFSKDATVTNTEATTSKSLSLLCQPEKPSYVPPSTSPVYQYGETRLYLRKENSIDRKEHVEVSVSETILIHSTKSSLESRCKPNSVSHASKLSSFLGQQDHRVSKENKEHHDEIYPQHYAQVNKSHKTEASTDLDHNEYDGFILSPVEISTSRDNSAVHNAFPINDTSPRSKDLKDNDENVPFSVDLYHNTNFNQDLTNALGPKECDSDSGERSPSPGPQENEAYITERDSMTSLNCPKNEVVIPRLNLGSLTDEESLSPVDSPNSDMSPEIEQEEPMAELTYANFTVTSSDSETVPFVSGYSEEQVSESGSEELKASGVDPCLNLTEPQTNISNNCAEENFLKPTLDPATKLTGDEPSKPRGILENLKESYALPNKPNINTGKSADASSNQNLNVEKTTKTQKPQREPAASNPVKKLSVEYTDPVELHSSDILQAGGVARDPHEVVSPAWSEDTDEETHKVKKRQNNPLKRLFARKKGKYSPSLDIDASKSILPTLEPEKPKAKKMKSSSPRLFKRKNKAKLFSSESELSPSDENTVKQQKKDAKKKQKAMKLTKENIVVIKSSGKSLSDSMPELVILAQSSADDKKEVETSTKRTRANTDDGSFKEKGDNANIFENGLLEQKPVIVEDLNKNHFYANVTLRRDGSKESETVTFDTANESNAVEVCPNQNKIPGVGNISEDDFGDESEENSFADKSATDDLMDMPDILKFSKNIHSVEANEEAGDINANTPMSDNPVGAADIDLNLETRYDRSPIKEFPQSLDNQDTGLDIADKRNVLKQNQEEKFTLEASEQSILDQEPRKNKYLYIENNHQNNSDLKGIASPLDESQMNPTDDSSKSGKLKDTQKQNNETRRDSETRRVLASIETTESDDELDEKLLETAAAENPLRRPKYAMTRLQAQLAGKPVPKEPILMESRYADKTEDGDEEEEMSAIVSQHKAEKERTHRDRIGLGEKDLGDASDLDTSIPAFSPRSDVSSDATDGDVTSRFDDVIDLCGSVESLLCDEGAENHTGYKTSSGLSRTPSQLLIRADVHTALNSDETNKDFISNENVQYDEGVKSVQPHEETKSLQPQKDVDITSVGGNIVDKKAEINAESESSDKNENTLGDKYVEESSSKVIDRENDDLFIKPNSIIPQIDGNSNISLEEGKNKFDKHLEHNDDKVSDLDDGYARWPGKKNKKNASLCQSPTSSSALSNKNTKLYSPSSDMGTITKEETPSAGKEHVDSNTLQPIQLLQDEKKSKPNSHLDPTRGNVNTTDAKAVVTAQTNGDDKIAAVKQAECWAESASSLSATHESVRRVKKEPIDLYMPEKESMKNENNNLDSKPADINREETGVQRDGKETRSSSSISNSQTKVAHPLSNINDERNIMKECSEEKIVPSVKPRVDCNVFSYTDRLQMLGEESTEVVQRPPAIKPKPPSWKMKEFLRKFDKPPSPTKPPVVHPKPQRHRPGTRESINMDLIQDAMKELEEHIDDDFSDESDKDDTHKPSKPTKSSTQKQTNSSGSKKASGDDRNMPEVFEEAIVKSEAPKEKSIPIETIFTNLDMRDEAEDQASRKCYDEKVKFDGIKVSPGSLDIKKEPNMEQDHMNLPEHSVPENIANKDNTGLESKGVSPPYDFCTFKGMHNALPRTKADEKTGEAEISKSLHDSEECGLNQDEPERKHEEKQYQKSEVADAIPKLDLQNILDHNAETEDDTKINSTRIPVSVASNLSEKIEQQFDNKELSQDIKVGKASTNVSIDEKQAQPSALLKGPPLGGPPPIPVKKAKEPQGTCLTPPSIFSQENDIDQDKLVVDIGYEDVLDKLSEPEKSSEEKASTEAQTKPSDGTTQVSSPSTKRFHFPWRKKSKDVLAAKKTKPDQEDKRKNATEAKDIKDINDHDKTKPTETPGTEDLKKSEKQAKEKGSKRLRKRKKEKTDKSSNSKEAETKKKTKKEKKEPKPKGKNFPVELYHEIEEGAANKEKVNKSKLSPSCKNNVASPSTSASSSPLSSSPLSDDSSDESYYEPVNYVDERELRMEMDDNMKKKLKPADSNGYEIPAEGQTLDTHTNPLNQHDQHTFEEYSLPPDSMGLTDSNEAQDYNSQTRDLAHNALHQYDSEPATGEDEPIEPYLTFQYPRYLDDGEIYVGNPVALKLSPYGTLKNDSSDLTKLLGKGTLNSAPAVGDDIQSKRNKTKDKDEGLIESGESSFHGDISNDTIYKSTHGNNIVQNDADDGNNTESSENDSEDMNYYNNTPLNKNNHKSKNGGLSNERNTDLVIARPKVRNSVVSPDRVSSPELAVKSHITEALSKAFQDFDFGFDGSGPISDAGTSTASHQDDKDRVSSIQWEWKDPPKSKLIDSVGGPKKNVKTDKTRTQTAEDKSCPPLLGVQSSIDTEMPLAGVGASVVLGEVKPLLGDSEGGMYDPVNTIGNEGKKEGDKDSLSSVSSSITASPPSSPVSDKPHKERGRLGKALARRQAKSRDKSKDKPSSSNVKRTKSKDKAKTKPPKDGKRDKSKSRQLLESDKTKNKIKRKESDEKEKWKWPWQRKGSKQEAGNPSANESDKDSETSKEGSKSNPKRNKKKSVPSLSETPKAILEGKLQESDKDDVPLNECNPSDEATGLLLESDLRNSSDDHDYFNTFLDSNNGFQLPQNMESYLSNNDEAGGQERVSMALGDSSEIVDRGFKNDLEDQISPASLKNYQFDEEAVSQHIDGGESDRVSLGVSDTEQEIDLKGYVYDESSPVTKDIPWSMCQVPDFQSSCSLSSQDPWKDYSPVEFGKTKSASEQHESESQDPNKEFSYVRKDSASRVDEFLELEAKVEAEAVSPAHQDLNLSPAVLVLIQESGVASSGDLYGNDGDEKASSVVPKSTLAKPKAACRTVSQPIKCQTPPVPRVRKTVRRHHSELATPDESFVVEFTDLWNSSVSSQPEEPQPKRETIPSISSQTSIYNEPAPGCRTSSASERSSLISSNSTDKSSERRVSQTSMINSDLELKPKTRRVSATLMDGSLSNIGVPKKIPPKPERKGTFTSNTEGKFRRASQDEDIADIFARRKLLSDDGDASEVEYDRLPIRQKKISSKMALKSSIPPVPTKRPVDERVVYTPVNRSPAQRLKSEEKTEYAAPWEESIKALTPTLPPRQYKRSIGDTARVDSARESRHSFTSIDLGQVDPDQESNNTWSLRKSVSLDYGLDHDPYHSRFGSVGSEENKDKLSQHASGKTKRPLFRSFFSLFRRSKKPEEAASSREPNDEDDDEESVFGDGNPNIDHINKENQTPKTKAEKPKKFEKTPKPEKAPKPSKAFKKQNNDSAKKKISAPFLDDRIMEVLNPGLEGRSLCRLLKVNEDETRVVEMIRPQTGPLGIFFTKGQEYNDEGLLVNAFQDPHSCKLFAGILGVGDQVLEIDGCDIRQLSLDQVGDLMQDKERMIVRVMPASVARSAL